MMALTGVLLAVLACAVALVLAWVKYGKTSSKKAQDTLLRKKFVLRDGITFYDYFLSPCARRVRITLEEKGIDHHVVHVNLEDRENRHPSFLAINPLGKVPAMVVRGIPGIPNCCLYESNAITEWLDEQFPHTVQLYPSDPWQRAQAKMWQRWESVMAEDFWPLLYSNCSGFVFRLLYSRDAFQKKFCSSEKDPYQVAKSLKTYRGEILSPREMRRNAVRLFKWLDTLERALEDRVFICGDGFTTADISVIPRTAMYPLLGLLETAEERKRYPNVLRYLQDVASKPSFQSKKWLTIMSLVRWIPWSLVEWISNWRSGMEHRRIHGIDVLKEVDASEGIPLQAAPPPLPGDSEVLLYHHTPWPESAAVRIACTELGVQFIMEEVDMARLQHRAGSYLRLSPLGEVPTIFHAGHTVYDAKNIMEYLDTSFSSLPAASGPLLPAAAIDRVRVRMWQGWAHTCLHYQLVHLYKQYVLRPVLRGKFSAKDDLLAALQKSTTAAEHTDDLVHLFEQTTSSEEVEKAMNPYKEGLRKSLEHLDSELKEREFLVASRLTAADVSVFSLLLLFKWVHVEIGEEFPSVTAWMSRLVARPAFFFTQAAVDRYMLEHGI